MIYVSRMQDRRTEDGRRVRLGVDACPGTGEYGHGLTLRILHDDTCCAEWAAVVTPWPGRAAEWRAVAGRWGSTWPRRDRVSDQDPAPSAEKEANDG